jgi:hypothetical protein
VEDILLLARQVQFSYDFLLNLGKYGRHDMSSHAHNPLNSLTVTTLIVSDRGGLPLAWSNNKGRVHGTPAASESMVLPELGDAYMVKDYIVCWL